MLLAETGEKVEVRIGDTLDAFHTAASEADLDGYLGLMTAEMVFLGTDGTERWQGEAFREFVTANFSQGRGWTYIASERHIAVSGQGDLAWFDELLDHDQLGRCRGSGVLVREAGGWRIAQYNLSVPIPNSMVISVAEVIRGLDGGDTLAASVEIDPPLEELAEEESPRKRCGKRFKTNRRADCQN